jgi:hypothetical protein
MELKLFATCNGLERIYPGTRQLSFDDVGSSTKNGKIGNNCYALSLKESFVQFSKLLDINDFDNRSGGCFMRILLELNYNETNNGQNIFDLLNQVQLLFKNNFIINNKIDLHSFNSNINLLEGLVSSFTFHESPSRFGSTISKQSTSKNAHIYYRSEQDLIRYFNQPKQNEFLDYNTIYFIHDEERAPDINPMHRFLNYDEASGTDLTHVVDLDNIEYQISDNSEYEYTIKQIHLNGETEKKIGDFIRLKDRLKITFKKRYHTEKSIEGLITDQAFHNILNIDYANKSIKIINSPKLQEKCEKLQVSLINNVDGASVPKNLSVSLKNDSTRREIQLNINTSTFEFYGEEWGQKWTISIKNGSHHSSFEMYDSQSSIIIPEHCNQPLPIRLKEMRDYTLRFTHDNKKLDNVLIIPYDSDVHVSGNKITISDKKIYKPFRVEFSCHGYETMKIKFDAQYFENNAPTFDLKLKEEKRPPYIWYTILTCSLLGLSFIIVLLIIEVDPPSPPPIDTPIPKDTCVFTPPPHVKVGEVKGDGIKDDSLNSPNPPKKTIEIPPKTKEDSSNVTPASVSLQQTADWQKDFDALLMKRAAPDKSEFQSLLNKIKDKNNKTYKKVKKIIDEYQVFKSLEITKRNNTYK